MQQQKNVVIKNRVIVNRDITFNRAPECLNTGSQDLQRLSLSLPNSMRGRFRIKYAMTDLYNNAAFTLIELLVVVLIIGILAAVAVPQYKKSVEKARITPYIQQMRDIIRAEQVYYLAHGEYTPNLRNLDIDFTKICSTNGGTCGNELYNCKDNVTFNLPAGQYNGVCQFNGTPSITLRYCPDSTEQCNYLNQNYALYLAMPIKGDYSPTIAGRMEKQIRNLIQ